MELPAAGITDTLGASSTDRAAAAPPRRAILDSRPAQIAVIDHNGVITCVSEAAI